MTKEQELDTLAKIQSRDWIISFIEYAFPSINKRKHLKVVFFPGEEAIDYYEIFKPLGIQGDNVFGVEKKKKIVERLKKGRIVKDPNTGEETIEKHPFRILHIDALDFFKNTEEKFDIISLDYTGQYTKKVNHTLLEIFVRDVLNSPGILHTNFFGMMEKEAVQKYYRHVGEEMKRFGSIGKKIGVLKKSDVEEGRNLYYNPEILSEARNKGLTSLLTYIYQKSFLLTPFQNWIVKQGYILPSDEEYSLFYNILVSPLLAYGVTLHEATSLITVLTFREKNIYVAKNKKDFDYIGPKGSHMHTIKIGM